MPHDHHDPGDGRQFFNIAVIEKLSFCGNIYTHESLMWLQIELDYLQNSTLLIQAVDQL